ncbi:MAG: 6-carboxytetrahydropterin synthase [Desulforhopalus sp.]
MYSLGVRREFTARHYLTGGDWGEENIEHSHSYRLELVLRKKTLDRHGFLVDIVEVERHMDEITDEFQGKVLNTLPAFEDKNPSIERLATLIHDLLKTRFHSFRLEDLTVTIREDDIAWTSYHASF